MSKVNRQTPTHCLTQSTRISLKTPVLFHSPTATQFVKDQDFTRMLQLEEEYIKRVCDDIIAHKPDLVVTEKGISGELLLQFHSEARWGWALGVLFVFLFQRLSF